MFAFCSIAKHELLIDSVNLGSCIDRKKKDVFLWSTTLKIGKLSDNLWVGSESVCPQHDHATVAKSSRENRNKTNPKLAMHTEYC